MTAEPRAPVQRTAGQTGVTRDSIDRWIGRKHPPAHRVGRLWRVQLSAADDWGRAGGADEEQRSDGHLIAKRGT